MAEEQTSRAKPKAEEAEPKAKKQAELVAETAPVKTTAKAGKRSAKSLAEAEEKQAKQTRKAETEAKKTSPVARPTRSRTERAGKKYREAAKLIQKDKLYNLAEALELAAKTSATKFDATVEMHINLGVDPRQADQNVRDTVVLPAGTGKEVRVAAIADDAQAQKLFAKLDKGEIDFDVLVATPALMPKLGKYARLLGPRGLMPNPKSGTVTADVDAAVKQAKAGRVEYRVDQAGIIHLGIGKVSFGADKLNQNATAVLTSVRAAKPASLKGVYIRSISVSSSMGPGIRVAAS